MRRARRGPYPRTKQNTVTLPSHNRLTDINNLRRTVKRPTNHHLRTTLHRTWTNQDTTNQHRHGRAGYTNNVRRCNHRQQRDRTHANQAVHGAVKTTTHQPHRSCSHDLTVNGPDASRPTPNPPGVHGSQRERRPTVWRHCSALRPPETMPTNKTKHCDSTITQPNDINKLRRTIQRRTDQPQRPTSNPRPPGRAQARLSQEA